MMGSWVLVRPSASAQASTANLDWIDDVLVNAFAKEKAS